jgi:hypothetical protein
MLAAGAVLAAGCGGDVAARLKTDVAYQTQVMGAFAESPELAGKMVDLLLAGNTRPVVVERVLGNGTVVQDLMTKIAQDRTIWTACSTSRCRTRRCGPTSSRCSRG